MPNTDSRVEDGEEGGTAVVLKVKDPKKEFDAHLEKLRHYAHRTERLGETLSVEELEDRTWRMLEFRAIGSTFKLTNREMTVLLYKGILPRKRGCGCPTCQPKSA